MKRILYSLLFIAAAAMTINSCDKSGLSDDVRFETLTFSSEKPSFDDDRKTHWNGTTVQWSQGDKIRMAYTVNGIWQKEDGNVTEDDKTVKFYASNGLDSDCEIAEFSVPGYFKGEVVGEHIFYALYPSAAFNGSDLTNPLSAPITVPAEQPLSSTTFYADADLMVAKSSQTYDSRPTSAVPLTWNRIVAHAYITLSALKDAEEDEVVTSVVLTADEDSKMAGAYSVNLTTGETSPRSGATNVLTLTGAGLALDASGSLSFWACMMPCTWQSVTVAVETDKATYTREIDLASNQKTFRKNSRNLLTVNMGGDDVTRTPKEIVEPEPGTGKYYVKVTSAPADWSGTYLIVCDTKSIAMNGSMTTTLDVKQNYVSVDITANGIKSTSTIDTYSFTIEVYSTEDPIKYKVCSASGRYIGRSSSGAGINNATSFKEEYTNTIDFADGNVVIKGNTGYTLTYDDASNRDKIAYYSAVDCPLQLYRLEQ